MFPRDTDKLAGLLKRLIAVFDSMAELDNEGLTPSVPSDVDKTIDSFLEWLVGYAVAVLQTCLGQLLVAGSPLLPALRAMATAFSNGTLVRLVDFDPDSKMPYDEVEN